MELKTTSNRGFQGTLHVTISAEQFPAITRHCLGDPAFQQLIADNLERVIEEYLNAAEIQVAATTH